MKTALQILSSRIKERHNGELWTYAEILNQIATLLPTEQQIIEQAHKDGWNNRNRAEPIDHQDYFTQTFKQ